MRTVTLDISTDEKGPAPKNCTSKIYARAVRAVSEMDEADGCSICECPIDLALRTITAALGDGIQNERPASCAEALVMLEQVELSVRRKSVHATT